MSTTAPNESAIYGFGGLPSGATIRKQPLYRQTIGGLFTESQTNEIKAMIKAAIEAAFVEREGKVFAMPDMPAVLDEAVKASGKDVALRVKPRKGKVAPDESLSAVSDVSAEPGKQPSEFSHRQLELLSENEALREKLVEIGQRDMPEPITFAMMRDAVKAAKKKPAASTDEEQSQSDAT